MIQPTIRRLTADDLAAAFNLSSTAGWNQRIEDWNTLLRLAPTGSFAAFDEDRIVGTAIGIDYGGFAWIAMMLVDPNYRGRGLGARLLEAAMAVVPNDRVIRLDATPMGRPLYTRYGFVEESTLTRFVATASSHRVQSVATADRLALSDLNGVADYDRRIFGGNRRPVLEWSLADAPAYARVVRARQTEYCLGRHGRLFDQIGPVVALDEESASRLVASGLTAAGDRPVAVDAFDSNTRFTACLGAAGFHAERPLFRMRREPARKDGSVPRNRNVGVLREFAIFGPEFG